MAGFLWSQGVMAVLVLALAMAPLALAAEAAELGHHVADGTSNIADGDGTSNIADGLVHTAAAEAGSTVEPGSREELDACDHSNPIRMPTDGPKEVAMPQGDQAAVLAPVPAQVTMLQGVQATAPADGPSGGATSLAVSLPACAGMALLGLLMT